MVSDAWLSADRSLSERNRDSRRSNSHTKARSRSAASSDGALRLSSGSTDQKPHVAAHGPECVVELVGHRRSRHEVRVAGAETGAAEPELDTDWLTDVPAGPEPPAIVSITVVR